MTAGTTRCWVCGGSRMRLAKQSSVSGAVTSEAFAITDSSYGTTGELAACVDCGFLQCTNLTDVLCHYEGLRDEAYEEGRAERTKQAGDVLRIVHRFRPTGRLLDIGAGSGILVEEAGKAGYECEGVEPSQWLCEQGWKRGLPIHRGIFPHPDVRGPFDIVSLVDVIEHVDNPVHVLSEIAKALQPDGVAVVVTPDLKSLAARLMKWKWWHFRVAHIGYFDKRTLNAAATKAGLQAVWMGRPLWYFKMGYLIDRAEKYLPRFLHLPYPQALRNFVIPLNLHDSLTVVYRLDSSKRPSAL